MYSIERFEGDRAVLDRGGERIVILRSALPPDAREGDVLRRCGHAWYVDNEATQRRRQALIARRARLREEMP
ncbi:MAG: DUF3006 domain-containing protein [Oscillospiraceae bacterium]|nr:DUF3006 domain-containing protein [Oscillospiraceae bacterium]